MERTSRRGLRPLKLTHLRDLVGRLSEEVFLRLEQEHGTLDSETDDFEWSGEASLCRDMTGSSPEHESRGVRSSGIYLRLTFPHFCN
jgi:hypothetical protein